MGKITDEQVACEATMLDHTNRFWSILKNENVRILVEMRRDTSSVPYWDSSSFPDAVAKALVSEHAALSASDALTAGERERVEHQWRVGRSDRHQPDDWKWSQWQPGRKPQKADTQYSRYEERALYTSPPASELEALRKERDEVEGLLQEADFWIEGALNCKTWNWDADQHEAATDSLQRIRAARRVRDGGQADG